MFDDDDRKERGIRPAINLKTGELNFLHQFSDNFAFNLDGDSDFVFMLNRWGIDADDDHYFFF